MSQYPFWKDKTETIRSMDWDSQRRRLESRIAELEEENRRLKEKVAELEQKLKELAE